ncbi:MAG: cellulose biosynthesis cyclic di-GMP-binding regulatory protein BcsB [Succinivibrio sp.]|nr:cellulose biosynthesis cyclic di-GMP-binding regulatory protein BcsB [Succinivibrio sp.]
MLNNIRKNIIATFVALTSFTLFSAQASEDAAKADTGKASAQAVSNMQQRVEPLTVTRVHYPISSLQWLDPTGGLALSGLQPQRTVRFTIKRDELVTDAKLELVFTPSPSLIPVRSQLNIHLNGLLIKSIPITKESLGVKTTELIELESRALTDENQITFDFIGHYTDICENPVDSTIWLNVSAQSILHLEKQKLNIANDLAAFPTPFFDIYTNEKSVVSVIMPQNSDNEMLKAAAIVTSYGGKITKWRGVDYPAFIDQLPASGNAIVFLTNSNKPEFLKDYPEVKVPSLEVADIPGTQSAKMLIVSAPDSDKLVTAAKALASGTVLLSGPLTEVYDYEEVEKRKPYDAPNWADTSKVITFGSLAEYDQQLSSKGYNPMPINIELNFPPDLYFVNGSRIDMNLIYKYTKPSPLGLSQLRFITNNHLVRSYPLKPERETDIITENLPILGTLNLFNGSKVDTSFLNPRNTLTFDFDYSMVYTSKINECTTQVPIPNQVEIDPSSSIDFTDIYHFTKLPNLNFFWQSGYPFSIYADLQNTAVYIDNPNDVTKLSTLFNTVARIAAQIGYSCNDIDVFTKVDEDAMHSFKNKDILVVGHIPDELKDDDNSILVLGSAYHALSTSFNEVDATHFDTERRDVNQRITAKGAEGLGAVISYRSPLNEDRTLVALIADSDKGLANIAKNLILNSTPADPRGTVAIFKAEQVRSYDVGETYFFGNLPWYQRIYYILLDSPWVLMFLCLFSAIILCYLCYRFLKHIQISRLRRRALSKEQ